MKRARGSIGFFIATVADPELTRDTLRFDRSIESIQNAVEASGYRFDRYWLPGRPGGNVPDASAPAAAVSVRANPSVREPSAIDLTVSRSPAEPTAADQPGVLLFRRQTPTKSPQGTEPDPYDDMLAVFIVGESPVVGIRPGAFANAMTYASMLGDPRDLRTLRIAGPTYSGSFPSLQKAFDVAWADTLCSPGSAAAQEGTGSHCMSSFRVLSPSATVASAGWWFRRNQPTDPKPHIRYDAVVHNDRFSWDHFARYLGDRWGGQNDSPRIAVLSESTTAFGRERLGERTGRSPTFITFPREIARLRNAYPEATAGNLFGRGPALPAEQRLSMPLRDPATGRDSVPTFAREQRPVAQEAVLLTILETLSNERIQLVQIVATDVLDAIFLSGFVRQALPEVRVTIFNADMLYVRAGERLPLVGSLAVTTFPLTSRSQSWSAPESALFWPMASRYELGLFNACRALLLEAALERAPSERSRSDAGARLLEFDLPQLGYDSRPPLWLVVAGRSQYWPVALLDYGEQKAADPLQLSWSAGTRPESTCEEWPDPGGPTRLWTTLFWIVTIGVGLFGLTAVVGEWIPSSEAWRATPLFALAVRPAERGASGRACFILARSLALGATLCAVAAPVWKLALNRCGFAWWPQGYALASVVAVGLAAFAPLVAYGVLKRGASRRGAGDDPWSFQHNCIGAFFALAFVVFVSLWWHVADDGAHMEPFFFAYRSLDLLNGVSPVLPMLVLGAGICLLGVVHARRHALSLELPPALPRLDEGPEHGRLASRVQDLRDALGHPLLRATASGAAVSVLSLVAVLFLIPFLRAPFQSLEGPAYELTYSGVLLLLYVTVVLAWSRVLLVWTKLKGILDQLERSPIHLAFGALPAGNHLPFLQTRGKYALSVNTAHSVEALRDLARHPLPAELSTALAKRLPALVERVNQLGCPGPRAAVDLERLREVHRELEECQEQIEGRLRVEWSARGAAARESSEAVRLAEQFVALQFLLMISNALLQVRNLLYFVTVGFFLGVVSALVYPFRAQNMIIWAATAVFVVFGAPLIGAVVQMEYHPMLRRIARREDGWRMTATLLKLAAYGALPLLGLISSHFPEIGRFVVAWLEPAIRALPQ